MKERRREKAIGTCSFRREIEKKIPNFHVRKRNIIIFVSCGKNILVRWETANSLNKMFKCIHIMYDGKIENNCDENIGDFIHHDMLKITSCFLEIL